MQDDAIINIAEITGPGAAQQTAPQEVIVKYSGDIVGAAAALGGRVDILSDNYAIVTLPLNQIPVLYGLPEVQYLELPKNLTFVLSRSLSQACITFVQSDYGYGLRGGGVVVGVIDSGIDYTHPDFRNPDGTSRILYLWDQSVPGNPPPGFTNGTMYGNEQLNEALNSIDPFSVVPARDEVGHGTAVSGIAAGNGRASNGLQVGAAPQSSLIVVKLGNIGVINFTRSTEIMRGIKFIMDRAEELNMPVSINISYGTSNGGHDGNSLFETYIDEMAQTWKCVICVATGNEGAAGHHFAGIVTQSSPVSVEFVTSGNMQQIHMPLWKNFVDTFTYELIAPSGRSTGVLLPIQNVTSTVLDNVEISIFFGQPTHYSEAQEIFVLMQGQNRPIPQGFWTFVVRGTDVVDGRFDVWLPTVDTASNDTAFLSPNVEVTLTLPSTSQNVISVGGYNSLIGNIADFSGRGYTRNNVYVKPDIVAPAVAIMTTRSGGGYDSFSGTSMAAPFVTGSAALMMEWGIIRGNDPFLYGQRIKAFLQKGARRELAAIYPNPSWGYGTLCLNNTMNLLVEYMRRGGPA